MKKLLSDVVDELYFLLFILFIFFAWLVIDDETEVEPWQIES